MSGISANVERRPVAGWVAWALWWAPLIWGLIPAWSTNVEQAYGWGVPVFAAYFAAERLRHAPQSAALVGRMRLVAWAILSAAVVTLPVALTILTADPTWPAMQWVAFAAVAVATLAGVALDHGGAWARQLTFPVLFFATALSWPTVVTATLVGALVSLNAQLAAAVVSILGHPAVVSGSVIEVATGFVGLDEACSGLRSLQAVWMAGWFFGELFSFSWRRRLELVTGAAVIAVVGNWMRTTALTWRAAAESPAAAERWHDAAGTAELVGTIGAVALLGWWMARRVAPRPRAGTARFVPGGKAAKVVLAGGILALGLPAAWYGWHEARPASPEINWELVAPGDAWNDYRIPERAVRLLRASGWRGFSRVEPDTGARSYALLVNWNGGNIDALGAEMHDPTICLPMAGIAVTVASEPVEVDIGRVRVEFTEGRFRADGRGQRVYYCHWDARLGQARGGREANSAAHLRSWRLERAWRGQRRAGAAFIALVVPAADGQTARAWFREWAPRLLRRR